MRKRLKAVLDDCIQHYKPLPSTITDRHIANVRANLKDILFQIRIDRTLGENHSLPVVRPRYSSRFEWRNVLEDIIDFERVEKTWCIGGIKDVYAEEMERGYLCFPRELNDLLTFETFCIAASNTAVSTEYTPETFENLVEKLELISTYGDDLPDFEEIEEEILEELVDGIEYAFYEKFIAKRGYPDNILGKIAKEEIDYLVSYHFSSYNKLFDEEFVDELAFELLRNVPDFADENLLFCYFFSHPKGKVFYTEHKEEIDEIKRYLDCFGFALKWHEHGQALSFYLSYTSGESLVLVSYLLNEILTLLDEEESGVNIPA